MSTLKENKEKRNTEMDIMLAAEEVFLEKGYLLATTTTIAKRAGVTHAMLHYYFRTKEQIFFKVLDKNLHELFEYLKGAMTSVDSTFWNTLSSGVSMLFDFLNNHRKLLPMLYDVAKQTPELLERYKESTLKLMYGLAGHHKVMLINEIKAGRCNHISFEQLFMDIVMMTFSAFMFLPVISNIVKLSEADTNEFLRKRQEEIIKTLYLRLYGTSDEKK